MRKAFLPVPRLRDLGTEIVVFVTRFAPALIHLQTAGASTVDYVARQDCKTLSPEITQSHFSR